MNIGNRLYWAGCAGLLSFMAAAQVSSALKEVQNWDEGLHLAAGYSYLRTGDFRLGVEQPPLGKMLNALPLVLVNASLPTGDQTWKDADDTQFGIKFLYSNRVPADTILLLARSVTILLTLTLGLVLALWTRRHFGPAVALLALFLFASDPNLIAHGHYATTDLIGTLFIFVACLAWARYLIAWRARDLLPAGILLGLAIVSKFSALSLLPIFICLYLIRVWQQRTAFSMRHFLRSLIAVVACATLITGVMYAPETMRMLHGDLKPLPGTSADLQLPAHAFLAGLQRLYEHSQGGHEAYLLGDISTAGWWYYFPVVFAVKTPSAVLALFACALAASILALWRRNPRNIRWEWYVLAVAAAIYFGISMYGRINIGVRHILPIYPFLFILISAVVCRLRFRTLLLALVVALQFAEFVYIYPHFTAFFNLPSGGSANGPRYLLDSNLDWGQDLKKLKQYMDAHGLSKVCIDYFGNASTDYYGVRIEEVIPRTQDVQRRQEIDCVGAVSATLLYGLYVGKDAYRWLRDMSPIEKIGYSIYLYDLRKRAAVQQ